LGIRGLLVGASLALVLCWYVPELAAVVAVGPGLVAGFYPISMVRGYIAIIDCPVAPL